MLRPNATSSGRGGASSAIHVPPQTTTPAITKRRKQQQRPATTRNSSSSSRLPGGLSILLLLTGIWVVWYMYSLGRRTPATVSSSPKLKKPAILQTIRQDFYQRYGGQAMAQNMWEQASKFSGSLETTALRMIQKATTTTTTRNNHEFVMDFTGYSITVGRGNYFHQSFPFVLQKILEPAFEAVFSEKTHHPLKLVVHNAAIGGIPSFPYGFCLSHFVSPQTVDVVGWDYSLNEPGNDASVLEAWIRHAQSQLSRRPMTIFLLSDDPSASRWNLIQEYTKQEWLHDVISFSPSLAKSKFPAQWLEDASSSKTDIPLGLQHWNEFGAPAKCPGRGPWHPKYQEHALYAWLIALHFVDALELAWDMMHNMDPQELQTKLHHWHNAQAQTPRFGDTPVATPKTGTFPAMKQLLFGHEEEGNKRTTAIVKPISCRTSFLPDRAQDTDDHVLGTGLPSIVVSGMSPLATTEDILKERNDQVYQQGWVLDVSKLERDTKIKVEKCGGLGYIDMKIALYGIPQAGPLKLFLPLEHGSSHEDDNDDASLYFDDLVLCEANEKRPKEACQLDKDLKLTIGGVAVDVNAVKPLVGAGEYLKRPTCVHVPLPAGAKSSVWKDVLPNDTRYSSTQRGLVVQVAIDERVTREQGACCLSHVVWEQH